LMIPSLSASVAAPKQITPQTNRLPEPDRLRAPIEKDAPTGPPPSFEESFLARQAREALKPAELAPEAKRNPDDTPSLDPRAENSFAEIRALAAEPAEPLLDKRS